MDHRLPRRLSELAGYNGWSCGLLLLLRVGWQEVFDNEMFHQCEMTGSEDWCTMCALM